MRGALLSPIMFPCSTFELWWVAPPYFVDMSVDEPTVVRAPPLIDFPEWGVQNIFHRFLFLVLTKYISQDALR